MSEEEKDVLKDYFIADIKIFRGVRKEVDFDIFLLRSDSKLTKIFSGDTGIDYKRLAHYILKGVKNLYISKKDKDKFQSFIRVTPEKIIQDPRASASDKVIALLNMSEQNMSEIFLDYNIPESVAEKTGRVVRNFVILLSEDPKLLAGMLKLASHGGDYLYYHSLSVAIFGMLIAKSAGQLNSRMLELVAMGGFLHDIGKTKLAPEIVNAKTDLTSEQWKEMKLHPKHGLRMVEANPLVPDEVRYIIYQHHEEPNGCGYPNGLRGPVIFYPAKIVSVADSFCALISKRSFRDAYSPSQAIQIIEHEVGKFDTDLVKALKNLITAKFNV